MKHKIIYWVEISAIICLLFITVNEQIHCAQISQNPSSENYKKYKIFLEKFSTHKSAKNFSFLSIGIPRSIRNVLGRQHTIVFNEKKISTAKLLKNKFELIIKGWLKKKGNDFIIEFFVIDIKTNSILILADATGETDRRLYDLIDRMCGNIIRILKKSKGRLIAKPEIISIDREGNISVKVLKGSDLSSRNLQNLNLSNLNISEANLSNSNLQNSQLRNSNLNRTDLSGANLNNSDLSNSNLRGANLSSSQVRGTNFRNAQFYNTNISNAKIDNVGDFNIGIIGFNGAYAWFTAQGKIHKNFFIGTRIGFTSGENDAGQRVYNLPVIITATYFFLNKSYYSDPLFRPYLGIGLGYRFALNSASEKSFISTVYAGTEIFVSKRFCFFGEVGAFYNQTTIYPTAGLGFKIYLPNVRRKNTTGENVYITNVASNTNSSTANSQSSGNNVQSGTQAGKKPYQFLGIKLGVGISTLIQKADTEISDTLQMKPKISYNFGVRYIYLPDGKYGLIADIEYTCLGGSQSTETIKARTDIHYVSLNAMFGMKSKWFFAGTGFYFAIPVGAEFNSTEPVETRSDVYEMYKRPDFGFICTLGWTKEYTSFKFFAGIDFKISITSVFRTLDTITTPENYTVRNLAVQTICGFGF